MDVKNEILALRKLGLSILEISHRLQISLTEVCEVLYTQNNEDKQEDK